MILSKVARIRPMAESDLRKLEQAALADRATRVVFPTHIVEKDEEMIGYLSLGVVPMVGAWLHRERVTVRDSVAVMAFVDDVMHNKQMPFYAIPLHEGSKFRDVLEPLGCVRDVDCQMFYRAIKQ